MKYLNKEKIVSVEKKVRVPFSYAKYHSPIKVFGLTITPEYYSYGGMEVCYSSKEILEREKDVFFDETTKEFYLKPYLKYKLGQFNSDIQHFESEEEMNTFLEEHKDFFNNLLNIG